MNLNQILNIIGTFAAAATAIPGIPGWAGTALSIAAFLAGKLAKTPISHPVANDGGAGSP